ncbi:MAG: copper resistance protein B [Chromatiaceae bacterium]|nr:copper resistance protein B [Chromatiaceae bacterium]MCP5306994.1 copper resistance protein B [Chromatiaceae bacterium]MCP5423378.1 copper resistance protein B [Chromatiaceae bacterium]
MRKTLYGTVALTLLPALTQAMSEDDPILAKVMIDQLEVRATDGPNPLVVDARAWVGQDLNKLWLKLEGEYLDGRTTEAEVQTLYSRALAPYWDLQVGWRHDIRPKPERDWVAIGFEGLAPYWFEMEGTAFVGERGQVAARLKGEYEWMFTQRWVLSPELEVNLQSKDDEAVGVGSGVSDTQLGLRLRYEIRREFAPYIGVNWTEKYGKTADFARAEGEDASDVQFVTGVRAWF